MKAAVAAIREELGERLAELKRDNKLLEAQRLRQRTLYDLELLDEMGYCPGLEKLFPAPHRPASRRASAHAAELLPR